MKSIVVTIVCTWCMLTICAQPTAGTYTKHHQYLFTALQNQAGLTWLKGPAIGVNTERRFLLNALSIHTLAIAWPTHSGTFAGMLKQTGFRAWHEQLFGLAYSHNMGEKCSVGMQVNYLNTMTMGYGSTHALTAEAGTLVQITPVLFAGLHAFNPVNTPDVPVTFSAGLGYEASESFLLSTALIQQEGLPPAFKVMCEYAFIPQFLMELDWCNDPIQRNMAVSFGLKKLFVKVYAAHHPQLGFSPGTTIIWQV
ncbi:hypothetical protein [Chitinophaga sp. LS1]|uniref:hypothetical protein n=1 Tax=Chitinophaga sp. LS1 TaxID=3051176 RepID=UPI002AABF2A1|nr:hypothetical protein [Chitinophaga sp. LS1]WPV67296.1 hypothetical protein QQL36_00975 [Chitinophaga sp. LS1]